MVQIPLWNGAKAFPVIEKNSPQSKPTRRRSGSTHRLTDPRIAIRKIVGTRNFRICRWAQGPVLRVYPSRIRVIPDVSGMRRYLRLSHPATAAGVPWEAAMTSDPRQAAILALTRDSDAVPDTVEIVREKHRGERAVVAATFRNASGRLVRGFVGLGRENDSGWRASGGAWGSGPRDVPHDAVWSSCGGWGSGTQSVYGGWVNESSARRIRVTDANGRIEEDTIESGVAILMWDGDFDIFSANAELLGDDGQVIRTAPLRSGH